MYLLALSLALPSVAAAQYDDLSWYKEQTQEIEERQRWRSIEEMEREDAYGDRILDQLNQGWPAQPLSHMAGSQPGRPADCLDLR